MVSASDWGIFIAAVIIQFAFAFFYHCRYLHLVEERNRDQRILLAADGELVARIFRTDRTRGYK